MAVAPGIIVDCASMEVAAIVEEEAGGEMVAGAAVGYYAAASRRLPIGVPNVAHDRHRLVDHSHSSRRCSSDWDS